MPDLGDLLGFDFGSGGDFDWLDALSNSGFGPGDLDGLVYDTLTGEFVDASTIDPSELADLGIGGLDPNTPSGPVPNVPGGPTGTSLSDQLRSRAADSSTDGTQPFDWEQMADPSASIASAGGE